MQWAEGSHVSVDRVWFVSSLLLRVMERGGHHRLLRAIGPNSPEHAVSPTEMRHALSFIRRLGYEVPEVVVDEGEVWNVTGRL